MSFIAFVLFFIYVFACLLFMHLHYCCIVPVVYRLRYMPTCMCAHMTHLMSN